MTYSTPSMPKTANIWSQLGGFYKKATGASVHPLAEDSMLAYFLSEMNVRTRWYANLITGDAEKVALLGEIKDSLESFKDSFAIATPHLSDSAWAEAYRLERMLALIEPSENLLAELKRRVAEAGEEQIATAPRLVATVDATIPLAIDTSQLPPILRPNGESLLRALLLATLEELHYAYLRKFYARPIQKSATYRIVCGGFLAFILLIYPYFYLYADLSFGKALPLDKWSWLPLYTALTAGLFGALFSRLLYLQTNWDVLTLGAIKDAKAFTSIMLRGCVGMTGAVIVYFFLQSGVVGGGLFPHFNEIGLSQMRYPLPDPKDVETIPLRLVYPNPALALLVVWSFLSGFSERLVPSILQSTETAIGKNAGTK